LDAEALEKPVEMRLHRAPRHIQLFGDFVIITTL
jgi:hypothetical protein